MANHKRKRPKNRRAGCLYCKPHKRTGQKNGWDAQRRQEKRARLTDAERLDG